MAYTATDKEQIDEIKRWWGEYGRAIVVALILGLGIGGGWKFWHYYRAKQDAAASQIYQSMQQAAYQKQAGVVAQYAKQLMSQYGSTDYASLGVLVAAKSSVEKGDFMAAKSSLNWVMTHAKQTGFRELARIRMAQVLLQLKQPKEALTTLQKIDDNVFSPLLEQVKGQAYLALGDKDNAKAAFNKAHNAFEALGVQSPVVALHRGEL